MVYITQLAQADVEFDGLGGKASAIVQLGQSGLSIPAGFVLKTTAFSDSLVALQAVAVSGSSDRLQVPIGLSEAVQQELEQALSQLCPQGERVAVRSSAMDEDGSQHSFAGQLESFLNVEPAAVVEKILAVWRSGFSSRVLAYRQEHQLAPLPSPPAVLIQRMVQAEAAGVAFAADPITGQRGVTVINAVAGLADRLVSGEGEADTYRVDRQSHIIQRELLQPAPVLTDEQIQTIAQAVRQCGRVFGRPQDVEWAIEQGQLYLLQSRPITALEQADPDGSFSLWDNSNIVESFNGVTTPLTFSFARKAYEAVYQQFCGFMGVPKATIAQNQQIFRCMIGLIQGRIYYNLLSWYRMLALLPGTRINARFMEQMMGVRESLPESVVTELQQALRESRLQDLWRLILTVIGLVTNYFILPDRIRRYHQRLDRALALQNGDRPADLTLWRPDELVTHYRSLEQDLLAHWDAPLITDFFAMIFYGLLRRLTGTWCGDESASLQNNLIGGEGGVISAEPMQRMQAMAQLVRDRPLERHSLCHDPLRQILTWLPKLPELQRQYQDYLEKFGDRCLEELKLESATLHDDPLPLLRTIGQLAQTPLQETIAPLETRNQAEHQVRQALGNRPLRRLVFAWVLQNARRHVRNRENLRFERTRVFGRARRILLELGRHLAASDRLTDPQDVFYLEVDEILGFVEGNCTCTNLKGLVALRQTEFDRYRQLPPPSDRFETRGIVHTGNSFHKSASSPAANPGTNTRQGVGCSPGKVRGVVRVITNSKQALAQTDRPIPPHSILVAQSTDPGWILLFPHAAGLLVERGSLLSHVAIVSRELGIPMITALPGITQWLQDGDTVELDSSTGQVEKLAPSNLTPGHVN